MHSITNSEKDLRKMKFQFSQYEIEGLINDALAFGDETQIAERMGRSASLVSQMCNPHDDRESDFVKALKFVSAACDVDAERGRKLLGLFIRSVEKHLPDSPAASYEKTIANFNLQSAEHFTANMLGKSPDECLSELDDVIEQAVQLKKHYKEQSLKANQFAQYRPAHNGNGAKV